MAALFLSFLLFGALSAATSQLIELSNITIGTSLYTNTTPNYWPSPSAKFAFGFYQDRGGYRVGIWLTGFSNTTIVWTAMRDDPPLPPASSLFLSPTGGLLLRTPQGLITPISHTITTTQTPSYASMQDSGDLVIYDSSARVLWSSFDSPTSTLLAGQTLFPLEQLVSDMSVNDSSVGRFRLLMQSDGNLVSYPVGTLNTSKFQYWSTQTTGEAFNSSSLNLDPDGRLYVVNSTRYITKNLTEGAFTSKGTGLILYRASMDADGIFRLYSHQTVGVLNGSLTRNSISVLWSSIREGDGCLVMGICGPNSYCTTTGTEGPSCICPPGFDFVDPGQPFQGCKMNLSRVECEKSEENVRYTILALEKTIWEDNSYAALSPRSEEECAKACLDDCGCFAVRFKDNNCALQTMPLHNGVRNSSFVTKTLIKRRIGTAGGKRNSTVVEKTKSEGRVVLIVGLLLISCSSFIFIATGCLIYGPPCWRGKITSQQIASSDVLLEEINLRSFDYEELVKATGNFMEEIGRGSFGRVYKGTLSNIGSNKLNDSQGIGLDVAVKKLEMLSEEGEKEFRMEMKAIGRTHHRNLVRLLGFCDGGSNKLLVYEYMSNGSLANYLFKTPSLAPLEKRMEIALDIAKGIHYLHEECEPHILHCDIKSGNILMGESLTAKISDFGLAKILMLDQTRTYTGIRGTRGYIAPEWYKNTPITRKADVYSFGIVLMEILCCRRNVEPAAPEEEIILCDWVCDCFEERSVGKVVKREEVEMEMKMEIVERIVKVGLWCIQEEPSLRPPINKVILMLEGTVETPIPPNPSSSTLLKV